MGSEEGCEADCRQKLSRPALPDTIELLWVSVDAPSLFRGGENVDYYQGVVLDYLRTDRAVFVNPECCIQLKEGKTPAKNEHWYCDAVAVDFGGKPLKPPTPTVFLCEVSYAKGLASLKGRLKQWAEHWDGVCEAVRRECSIPKEGLCWPVRPWLFVPQESVEKLVERVNLMTGPDGNPAFRPRITTLESIQPWHRTSWLHRDCDMDKSKSGIPEEMWV